MDETERIMRANAAQAQASAAAWKITRQRMLDQEPQPQQGFIPTPFNKLSYQFRKLFNLGK